MTDSFIQSSWTKQDNMFERPLRPQTMKEFIGQEKIQKRLEIFIGAAKKRNEALGHCLLCGPPGLGKTTLASIIAKEMGSNIVISSGPVIEKPADLAGILTNLQEKDILFIDEIHRLPKSVEEYLYTAMESYSLDLLIDSGPNSRTVQINLSPFTLIGATTRSGLLSSPLRSRFSLTARLDYYLEEYLQQIVTRSSNILNFNIDEKCSQIIAKRSRGTPRIANNLLRWARDYYQMSQNEDLSFQMVTKALDMLGIDHLGLDEMDKKMLTIIIDNYNGGPVGLQTLSIALGEDSNTLAEVYEPYLIMNGFIKRTARGREVTDLAYEHIGRKRPKNHGDLS